MPINELETHPNWNYLGVNPDFSKFHSIIIGSFPIYPITDSIPVHPDGEAKRAAWNNLAYFQFYYGSRSNRFWNDKFPIAISGNPLPAPLVLNNAQNILTENGFLITDVIKSTYRESYSASDIDLVPVEFNDELIDLIIEMNGNSIYFTSLPNGNNNPYSWFRQLLTNQNINPIFNLIGESRNRSFSIGGKQFSAGFLFSPSPQGAINQNRIPEFIRYKIREPEGNFQEFVSEQWKQLLHYSNFAYDGSNPVNEPIDNLF